jgi:hypothetical protein
MLRRACLSLFVLASLAFLAPQSRAQALDGLWFKVTASVKGSGATDTGDVFNIKGKVVAYMFVALDDFKPEGGVATNLYSGAIYSEVTPDSWQQVSSTAFLTLGTGENVMVGPTLGADDDGVELPMALTNDGGEGVLDFVRLRFTAKIKVKLDGDGVVKKASFKSYGAVLPEGFSEGEMLFGGGKISGKNIDPSKLPFSVGS